MKKRKILIFSHAMEIGGAERSLLGLLEAIDPIQVDVDLFLMRHEGELLSYIPEYVNILPQIPEYTALARPLIQVIREGHLILALGRVLGKSKAAIFSRKNKYHHSEVALEYSHKYTKRYMPFINPECDYDMAISFLTPHYFVAEKVRAKKKIAWIHTDYSQINIDVESEYKMWSSYDKIVAISKDVSQNFLMKFASLESKIIEIENILPEKTIKKQMAMLSAADDVMCEGKYKLLSIGRFCEAKNFDNVPWILRSIRDFGLDAHWYLLGYGPDEELIYSQIEAAGMKEYVHMLNKTDNPYPFISKCDLYVQPSRYEGRCVTVIEAQLLSKPVVITRYSTSSSQLMDGIDGIIVEMDNEKCAEQICDLLRNESKLKQLETNCSFHSYSNSDQIEKVYSLMNN